LKGVRESEREKKREREGLVDQRKREICGFRSQQREERLKYFWGRRVRVY